MSGLVVVFVPVFSCLVVVDFCLVVWLAFCLWFG